MVPLVITCSTGRNPAWENAKKCGPDLSHCPGLPRPWPGCSHVHSLVLLTVFFLYLSLTLHWVWSLEEEAVWGYHHTQPMPTPSPSLIAWDFCPHCSGHTSWFWENFQWIAPYPGSWHSSSSLQRRFLTPILSSTFRAGKGKLGRIAIKLALYTFHITFTTSLSCGCKYPIFQMMKQRPREMTYCWSQKASHWQSLDLNSLSVCQQSLYLFFITQRPQDSLYLIYSWNVYKHLIVFRLKHAIWG